MKIIAGLVFGVFLYSICAFSQTSSEVEKVLKVAQDKNLAGLRQWQKLMHFEPQWGGLKLDSQIDSSNFFLDPHGDENLQAELEANIKAMWSAPMSPEEKIAQCIFPARYRFLKAKLSPEIQNFPDRECPRFEKYLKALHGTSVSLVFSSFYLNNPSSAFGHTFLRINKMPATDGKRYELLDYGINYAAKADTNNALFYALKGLFGFFPGTFTSVPYYYKVREYNNSESRDLWEYELNVSPETVDMLIAHVWELGQVYIDYWYLTENCSYHMLTILEAADPNIDVVARVKKWVIPSDTVKDAWDTPNLVKDFHFRPSVRTEFFHRIQGLSDEEQKILKDTVEQKKITVDFQSLSDFKKRDILDAAIDYVDFKYIHDAQKPGPEADFKRLLLTERSANPIMTEPLKIEAPPKEMPHLGHGSRRWSTGYRGSQLGNDFYLIGLKNALHDRTDLITGYPEYAAITFGDFQFAYSRPRNRLELDDFSLFEVISYSPLSRFQKSLSWRIKLGAESIEDENCLNCHGAVLSGGAGATFSLASQPMVTWFVGLRGAGYGIYHTDGDNILSGVGPSTEFRFRWTDQLLSTLEGWHRYNFQGEYRSYQEIVFKTQYSWNKNWAFQVAGTDLRYDKSIQGQLFYFY